MGARQADIDEANKDENKIKVKGIKWERSCTDVLCCLLFSVFLVVMVGLSAFALKNGNPTNILTAFDSVGNRCGQQNQGVELREGMTAVNKTNYTPYKYKYFTNLIPSTTTDSTKIFYAVCVISCPKMGETVQCMPNSNSPSCGQAAFDTTVVGQFCLPEKDDIKAIFKKVYESLNETNNFGKYMADIQNCW